MSDVLNRLADVIESRRGADPATSYVARLLAKGEDAILKKIGEEATETVMAAKDGDNAKIVGEMADLWFHCLLALSAYGLKPQDVIDELARVWGHLERRTKRAPSELTDFLDILHLRAEVIQLDEAMLANAAATYIRDPNDVPILATLLSSGANWLVTGDDDLLALAGSYPILKPAAFVTRFMP